MCVTMPSQSCEDFIKKYFQSVLFGSISLTELINLKLQQT